MAQFRGVKPAQWLADRIKAAGGKCGPRHANRLISGNRRPSAKAANVMQAAMLD